MLMQAYRQAAVSLPTASVLASREQGTIVLVMLVSTLQIPDFGSLRSPLTSAKSSTNYNVVRGITKLSIPELARANPLREYDDNSTSDTTLRLAVLA